MQGEGLARGDGSMHIGCCGCAEAMPAPAAAALRQGIMMADSMAAAAAKGA